MKILFNTGQMYLHGGIEKSITERANYWIEHEGHKVYIITTEQKGKDFVYPIHPQIKHFDLGINYNREKPYRSLENIRKGIRHFKRQKKLLKEIKPDVILSPNHNFDHYWLPQIKGKALLIKERHNSYYTQKALKNIFKKLLSRFNHWIYTQYDQVVVLNPTEQKLSGLSNTVVIPNFISPTAYRANPSAKKVLAAGRLAPVKRFDELIQIWKTIVKEYPDWELHIYGEDYTGTKAKLIRLIQQFNLENQVFIHDPVPDLRKTMQHFSIYAMTSETECFPTVLLEALSVGLPVVSYDAPYGPRHILSDGSSGFLIKNNHKEAFETKLKILFQQEQRRKSMSEKALKEARKFGQREIMKNWSNLISAYIR